MLTYKRVCFWSCNSYERKRETANMPKVCQARKRPGFIHLRAGCNLPVHGREKRTHKEAGCKYVTHGPNSLSKLITSLSAAQKSKTTKKKSQQTLSKRKGSTKLYDIINETLTPTSQATVRRSARKRKIPKRLVQEGSGKINNRMRNIEQARLIHQRRYGNPWMGNGYAARL